MNKRIIFIIVMLVILASLGFVVFFLARKTEVPVVLQQADEAEYVYVTGDISDIKLATIRNIHGEYTVRGGEIPSIVGYDDLPVNIFYFLNILDVCSKLVSYGLVTDDAEDLSVFGLAPAQAQLFIQAENGKETTLFIGNNAPDGSMYVKLNDSSQVFLASFFDVSIFQNDLFSLVDTSLTPPARMDHNETLDFEKIILGGSVRETITIIKADTGEVSRGMFNSASGIIYPFEITSPVNAAVSMEQTDLLESMFGLYADRFTVSISGNSNTRQDELSRYGLSAPWSTLELITANGSYRVLFSQPDNKGGVYIYREGASCIYEGAAANFSWLDIGHYELMNKIVILPFIDRIASIDIKTPEKTVSFALSGEGGGLTVKSANLNIDTGNFRTFYQNLTSARYDEYNEHSAGLPRFPFLEIVYNYRDRNRNADIVSFYQTTSRRVLTSLNGGRAHFTLSSYTDKIISDLDLVLAGERIRSYL